MPGFVISKDALRHVWRKHPDLARILGLGDVEDLLRQIMQVLENPDEIHVDRFRSNVKYYLKKIDDLWINIILVDNIIKTAYLISFKSYRKFRERRWC